METSENATAHLPHRIALFTTTKRDFAQHVATKLIDTPYVPTDIFAHIHPQDMERTYLPMFLYEGTFTARWTCRRQAEFVEADGKKRMDYQPAEGNTDGTFAFMLTAYEGSRLPDEIVQFSETIPYTSADFTPVDDRTLTAHTEIETDAWKVNRKADEQFSKRGKALLQEQAENAARAQLKGQKYKGLKTVFTHTFTTNGRLVYVPVWQLHYSYQQNTYYALMDGRGVHTAQTVPQDKGATRDIRNRYRGEVLFDIVLALLPLALVYGIQRIFSVALFSNWITWAVLLAVWLYLLFRVWMAFRHKRNALSEAQQLRRAASMQLLAQIK